MYTGTCYSITSSMYTPLHGTFTSAQYPQAQYAICMYSMHCTHAQMHSVHTCIIANFANIISSVSHVTTLLIQPNISMQMRIITQNTAERNTALEQYAYFCMHTYLTYMCANIKTKVYFQTAAFTLHNDTMQCILSVYCRLLLIFIHSLHIEPYTPYIEAFDHTDTNDRSDKSWLG